MRIEMPRGDIKWLRFKVVKPDGALTDINFSAMYFTVKRNDRDTSYLFQKSLKRGEIYRLQTGDYQLKIDSEDTNGLPVGNYRFDVQISFRNLMKQSFTGDFVLGREVTHSCNEDPDYGIDIEVPTEPEGEEVILTIPEYHVLQIDTPMTVTGIDDNYMNLIDKPRINGVTLEGSLTLEELGIQPAGDYVSEALTAEEIDTIIEEAESDG